MTNIVPDRRTDPRANVCAMVFVRVRHNEEVQLALYNLSIGGACLVGALTVQPGERLLLRLDLRDDIIEIHGEVVRAKPIDAMTDQVAVRFVEVSADVRARLRGLVDHFLDQQLDEPPRD
jgi:c-di-GMP-binding flagellar brake protein YcgR